MSGELLNPPGIADAAEHARERIEIVVNAFIEQYVRAPYDPESLMRTVDSILKAGVAQTLTPFARKLFRARADEAVQASRDVKKLTGRPATPPEILEAAVVLANWENEANRKTLSIDDEYRSAGAYEIAAARLREDFGIEVSANAIRAFRKKKQG
ncbi:MAG: hypothetical protein ACLQAR_08395 [Steroidobacteraceae bacterium]